MSDRDDETTSPQEIGYERGKRAAWSAMLQQASGALGYDHTAREELIVEREAAIAALRSLCAQVGDNEWDEHLHLADIIEKHLAKHLRP